jgi:hypothetical protein
VILIVAIPGPILCPSPAGRRHDVAARRRLPVFLNAHALSLQITWRRHPQVLSALLCLLSR